MSHQEPCRRCFSSGRSLCGRLPPRLSGTSGEGIAAAEPTLFDRNRIASPTTPAVFLEMWPTAEVVSTPDCTARGKSSRRVAGPFCLQLTRAPTAPGPFPAWLPAKATKTAQKYSNGCNNDNQTSDSDGHYQLPSSAIRLDWKQASG